MERQSPHVVHLIVMLLPIVVCSLPQTTVGEQVSGQQDTLKQHYEAGQKFQRAGDMAQASAEYRLFLGEALHRIANGTAKAGEFSRANTLYEEALRQAPDDSMLRLDYAKVCLDTDQLLKARATVERAVQLNPRDPQARFILGRILFNLEDYTAAKSQLEAATALNPDFETGYLLGTTYLLLHEEWAARRLFEDMIAGLGNTALIHIYFGRAYSQNDYPELAAEEFRKAIELDNHAPDAHYYLALAYLGHNEEMGFAKAIPEFRAELEINPHDFRSEYMLGYIARKQRDLPEAEKHLRRATERDPSNLDALLELAGVLTDTNRTAEAGITLRKAIAEAEASPGAERQLSRAHYLLGQILRLMGHLDEAKRELVQSAAVEKGLRTVRATSADERSIGSGSLVRNEVLTQVGSPAQTALTESKKALDEFSASLTPLIGEAYNNLGAIAAGQKDFPRAMEEFQKAREWTPSLEVLDRNFGMASFYAGHFDESVTALRRYLAAHPDDAVARSLLADASRKLEKN